MISLEKRLVRYPLYLLFFFVVFVVAMALSFPDTQIKEIAAVQIQKAVGPKYKVKIDDVDVWRFSGVELIGLTIKERVDEKAPEPQPGAPLPMKAFFPSIGLRLAPIKSIFNFGLAVKAQIDVGGGDIDIYATKKLSGNLIEVSFDELDLSKTGPLKAYLGLPFFGTLDGGGEILVNDKGLPIGGEINLRGSKITVGPADVKVEKLPMAYLEVPQSNFGNVKMNFKIKNISSKKSLIEFSEVGISGRDLRGEFWGYLETGGGRSDSANLKMRLQLDQTFVKKNKLSAVLNIAQFRKGKNKDWYGFTISGRMSKTKFKGSPTAAKGKKKDPVKLPTKGSQTRSKKSKKTKSKK